MTSFVWHTGQRVRIADPRAGPSSEGVLVAVLLTEHGLDQPWAVVIWDGDDDPSLFKATLLEIAVDRWAPLGETDD